MLKRFLAILALLYGAAAFAAVDVNTASAADLDSVKGIGTGMSTRILDERKKAKFKDWEDLISRVKGIGAKNAAKFSASGLTVNGATYAGTPAGKDGKGKADKQAAPATAAKPATPAAKPATATKS